MDKYVNHFRCRKAPLQQAWYIYPNTKASKEWSIELAGHIGGFKIWARSEIAEYNRKVEAWRQRPRPLVSANK